MKTILAATDFSSASHNACLYAASLAKAFHAELVLYHAYHTPVVPVTGELAVVTEEDMKAIAKVSLEKEIKQIDPQMKIVVRSEYLESPAADGILSATDHFAADLVILGMKQNARTFRKWFGSTATALIRRSKVPVMIVPEGVQPRPIRSIVLAYNADVYADDNVHLADMVKQLGHRFQAKVYLVHVAKTEFQEIYQVLNKPSRLLKMMGKLPAVTETLRDTHTTTALLAFVEEHHSEVLAVLPEKKSFLKRLTQGSTAKKMLFESKVPLLVMPGYHERNGKWWSEARHAETV